MGDLDALRDLPTTPFEACEHVPGQVSSTALVRYRLDYGDKLPPRLWYIFCAAAPVHNRTAVDKRRFDYVEEVHNRPPQAHQLMAQVDDLVEPRAVRWPRKIGQVVKVYSTV